MLRIALVILNPPAAPIPNTGFFVTRFEMIVHPMLDCGIECGNGRLANRRMRERGTRRGSSRPRVVCGRGETPPLALRFTRAVAVAVDLSRACIRGTTWYQVYGVKSRNTLLYGIEMLREDE